MKESEVGAMYEGFVHGWCWLKGKSKWLVPSRSCGRKGNCEFTAKETAHVQEHEPTLLEIWVCVDGIGTNQNVCPAPDVLSITLLDLLLNVFNEAVSHARMREFPELDRLTRARIAEGAIPSAVASDLPRRWGSGPSRLTRIKPAQERSQRNGSGDEPGFRQGAAACAGRQFRTRMRGIKNSVRIRMISAGGAAASEMNLDDSCEKRESSSSLIQAGRENHCRGPRRRDHRYGLRRDQYSESTGKKLQMAEYMQAPWEDGLNVTCKKWKRGAPSGCRWTGFCGGKN